MTGDGSRFANRFFLIAVLALFTVGALAWSAWHGKLDSARAAQDLRVPVDTALVVAVDVSNSVDDERYRLQMEGIAAALEDKGVLDVIFNGPRGAILFSIVAWSDRPEVAVPWIRISNEDEASRAAQIVRSLPRIGGEFTCMGRMLQYLNDKILPQIPAPTIKTVVDVSGDGRDNCNPRRPMRDIRDELAGYGTTINGLPILEGSEAETLEDWYRENVKGGPGSFILPANGFKDFGRAIRQKFLVEISLAPHGDLPRLASSDAPDKAAYPRKGAR